jgi:leucyl-tRNA synthetase
MVDYAAIEERWQRAWAEAKAFEAEPNDKPSIIVTAAFPYLDMPQHIGHLRTYGTADTYARYMRMQGHNVLYPMGFHATGTPVLAIAKRIKAREPEILDTLKLFGVPESEIPNMEDPLYITQYFAKAMETGMRKAGYGIDWRRSFVSIDPLYSKMVEWQFIKLKELGFLTQGSHPVGWCTNEGNAVGQHDTKHDVQPKIDEITVVKFKDAESDAYFGCATYRPETIYGVTNIFVNDSIGYVLASINGTDCFVAEEAAGVLSNQAAVVVKSKVSGKELLSKRAVNPINGETVPILPGFFVKGDTGTGVVMSVPSHAPFDYAALERLKVSGYPVPQMAYRKLLDIEPINGIALGRSVSEVASGSIKAEHPEIPALAYLEILKMNHDSDVNMLEVATKLVYREEAHWGVMAVGKYKGMKEPDAREALKKDLIESNDAFQIYVLGNEEPVICRCNTRVIVKLVTDQWFINYGDKAWKDKVRSILPKVKLLPENTRRSYEATIDWIEERAAERAQGLGTPFPYNPKHIIESLSDSTIYMAFYTFVHVLRANKVKPEQLKPEFFDYVISGRGGKEAVAASTGIEAMAVQKCRDMFDYWYSFTSRHSGTDLVTNHLTMYLFNQVAIMQEKNWPKQIVANALVNYEGEKMSKSLGNIMPLIDGIKEYGADNLRLVEIAGADLETVTEFSVSAVNGIKDRNEYLYKIALSTGDLKAGGLGHIDYWLYSKLNSKIKSATNYMNELSLKNAYSEIFYNSVSELKYYFARGGSNSIAVSSYMEAVSLMLSPVMPHFSEELWHTIGMNSLAVQERWPTLDEGMINEEAEYVEELIGSVISDISSVIALTAKIDANRGKKPNAVRIIIASPWKAKAVNAFVDSKDIGKVMSMPDIPSQDKGQAAKLLAQLAKKGQGLIKVNDIDPKKVKEGFEQARDYIAKQFKVEVSIELESDSKSQRASRSMPDKPSIDVSWA